MKPVQFHRAAEAELRAAIAYYESEREGLGDEFRDAVEQAVEGISKMPRAYSPHGERGLRKCVMRRFPFTIFFRELEDSIWIAAVAHQRRRPGYWERRHP